jgi:8-oxo-dGTP diphosphatase
VEECNISFVVIVAKYQGKLVIVRHRERLSWEIPGGHVEQGEKLDDTARRELFEETGAEAFNLTPVYIYSVNIDWCYLLGRFIILRLLGLECYQKRKSRK